MFNVKIYYKITMKLFIDTSGSTLIFALIDKQKKVKDFFKQEMHNNATAISIELLNNFLKKNKVGFKDINSYYFTTGPGSFTGMRIAINIFGSINLIYKNLNFYSINTFSLLREKEKINILIPFGKNKFYFKKYSFFRKMFFKNQFKVIKELNNFNESNSIIGYEKFDQNKIEYLIKNKKFKKVKSLSKVNLNYGN